MDAIDSPTCQANPQFCSTWPPEKPTWPPEKVEDTFVYKRVGDVELVECPRPFPYRCPVCNGSGQVCQGFYDPYFNTMFQTASCPTIEACRSCNGTGVLWK